MVDVFVVNNDLKNMEFNDEAEYNISVSIYKNLNVVLKGKDLKALAKLYNVEFDEHNPKRQNSIVEKIVTYHLSEKLEDFIQGIDFEKIIKESI